MKRRLDSYPDDVTLEPAIEALNQQSSCEYVEGTKSLCLDNIFGYCRLYRFAIMLMAF